MIFMTSFGIFMPAQRPKDTVPLGDPRTIQVRSRRRLDLVKLQRRYLPKLSEPFFIKDTDYQWRAYCTPYQLGRALAAIAEDINYEKFKDTAEDKKLRKTFLDVWFAIFNNFPEGSSYDRKRRRSR